MSSFDTSLSALATNHPTRGWARPDGVALQCTPAGGLFSQAVTAPVVDWPPPQFPGSLWAVPASHPPPALPQLLSSLSKMLLAGVCSPGPGCLEGLQLCVISLPSCCFVLLWGRE